MILRDPTGASGRPYDLLIIGGGIYGASVLHEATNRGLKACLCEAGDFGGETSWNSLRILHGGFRYLQRLDLRRLYQSAQAVDRWRSMFPQLVEPLECLLPLEGKGLSRPWPIRAAALLQRVVVGRESNAGILTSEERPWLPASFKRSARQGIATWQDCFMPSPERILMELLRDACRKGAVALNRVRVEALIGDERAVKGIRARDLLGDLPLEMQASVVVDCSGPAIGALWPKTSSPSKRLEHGLAINLLLDLELPGSSALAVRGPQPDAQTFFLIPRGPVTLAGTLHLSPASVNIDLQSAATLLVRKLDHALPGSGIADARILRVFAGMLPVHPGPSPRLKTRATVTDHGKTGGIPGFWSIRGTKYTMANVVAVDALNQIFGRFINTACSQALPLSGATRTLLDGHITDRLDSLSVMADLQTTIREESVIDPDDLLLRRSGWSISSMDPGDFGRLAIRAGLTPQ